MSVPSAATRTSRPAFLPFVGVVTVLTGVAFLGGKFLHDRHPADSIAPVGTRLAQADDNLPKLPHLQVADDKSGRGNTGKNDTQAKRARAAAATFSEVYDLVRDQYVDSLPSDTVLSHGAVQSMLSSLEDDQSYFLMPDQHETFDAESEGKFAGIGAITAVRPAKTKDGYTELQLIVVAPLPGSPAERAGLKTGDRITHLDGRYIIGDNPYLTPSKFPKPQPTPKPVDPTQEEDETDEPIRDGVGLLTAQMELRQGDSVSHKLGIARPGVAKPFGITVGTAVTAAPAVSAQNNNGVRYLRVPAFGDDAPDAVGRALANAPARTRVILDLRQNAGIGSLEAAEAIAAEIAPNPRPFTIELGVNGKKTPLSNADKNAPTHPAYEVAVLTDGGTAGFAEVLAAYLVDNGAALVGEGKTFGDGRTQTLYPLQDGSAFTLTTGRFVSPKGRSWERVGLAPQVVLPHGLTEPQILARAASVAGHPPAATVAAKRIVGGAK